MNIRIPVPKSSGSELFDDECRSHTSRAVRYRTSTGTVLPCSTVPYQYGTGTVRTVLTRVIQDAQSRKSLARARVARARPRAGIPDDHNELSSVCTGNQYHLESPESTARANHDFFSR